MEIKGKYIYAFLAILLAAMTCVPAHAADLPTTIWMVAPEIQLNFDALNVSYGDNQTIQITLYNPNDYAATGNLSLKIGFRTESGSYEYLSENMLESNLVIVPGANETIAFIYNWSSAGGAEGTYKAYLRFDYNGTYTTRYKTFDVVPTGDEDNDTGEGDDGDDGDQGGEERLEIISMRDTLDFGDVSTIGVRYDSGPYEHGKLRIIGYVSGPKKASNDLDRKTIYRNFCDINTGVEIRGVVGDSRFYLNIPLMLKDGCDGAYLPGDYEITVRVCDYADGTWSYYKDSILKKKRTVNISSNKDCAEEEMYDQTNEGSCENDDNRDFYENVCTMQENDKKSDESAKNIVYDVIRFDDNVYIGDRFTTQINIFNNSSKSENATIYSYVYDNTTLLSDGFDGSVWSHQWNSNKISFEIPPYSNKTVDLANKVDNAEAGLYKFRARMFYLGKKYDIDRWIAILERGNEEMFSVSCNMSDRLGQIRVVNKDSSDAYFEYYILDGEKWHLETVKIKKKSEKTIKYFPESLNVTVIVIDSRGDLHKCYISIYESVDEDISTVENHMTGDVLSQRKPEKKIGFIEWILGLLGM